LSVRGRPKRQEAACDRREGYDPTPASRHRNPPRNPPIRGAYRWFRPSSEGRPQIRRGSRRHRGPHSLCSRPSNSKREILWQLTNRRRREPARHSSAPSAIAARAAGSNRRSRALGPRWQRVTQERRRQHSRPPRASCAGPRRRGRSRRSARAEASPASPRVRIDSLRADPAKRPQRVSGTPGAPAAPRAGVRNGRAVSWRGRSPGAPTRVPMAPPPRP